MDLADVSFVFPAILFTLLAIILANTIFRKTAPDSPSETEDVGLKQQKGRVNEIGEIEAEVNEFAPGHQTKDGKSAEEVSITGEKKADDRVVEETLAFVSLASVGKDRGVVEQRSSTESIKTIPACPVFTEREIKGSSSKSVPEEQGIPEPAILKISSSPEAVKDAATPVPVPRNVTTRGLVLEKSVLPCILPESGSANIPYLVPCMEPMTATEGVQEAAVAMLEERLAEYSPENDEDDDVTTALEDNEEEEELPLKYALGKAKTSQLGEMMNVKELEEDQRIEFTTDFTSL